MSFSLCIVCDTKVSYHFFAVFVKMKDSRCAEEFVSASPILTGRIRMLDVLGSFGQKMSAIFSRTIWPQAMLQNENTITAFTFVASSLILEYKQITFLKADMLVLMSNGRIKRGQYEEVKKMKRWRYMLKQNIKSGDEEYEYVSFITKQHKE